GPDRLAVERRGWTLRVNDDDASAVVHLEANGGPAPDEVRTQTLGGWWTQSVPMASGEITGWLEAGSRGGALGGNGLLTWRGGDGAPAWPRRAVYVLGGADTSIGLDQHGSSRLAWGRLEGRDLDMTDAALRTGPDGGLVLDLRPAEQIVLSLTVRKTGGTTDPYDGLSGVEQQALRVVGGPPVRRVHLLQARVESGGLPVRVPAALVEVAAQGDLLPLSPRRPPR
ncbi:MAG: hypothetical protein VX000_14825, partial [Myxococcota bacterium]|nr:hypothetical protein [Myxococcota bacterium]